MTTMMPADQAAKVLREHNEWRQSSELNPPMPHNPKTVGHAIDAAVAALEVAASTVPHAYQIVYPNGYRFSFDAPAVDDTEAIVTPLYAAPQPAYCCAKCGLTEMHPRERALHQDAKRGNFRQEDDGA